MLEWEGAVVVNEVHCKQGKDLSGVKQGGLRIGCRFDWALGSGCLCAPCSKPIHFLLHCLSC